MRILTIGNLAIALALKRMGHASFAYGTDSSVGVESKEQRNIKNIKQFQDSLIEETKPELIIVADVGYGKMATKFTRAGIRTVCASETSDIMSNNIYKNKFMKLIYRQDVGKGNTLLESWWNGDAFVGMYKTVYKRKFMSGDLGADVDCSMSMTSQLPLMPECIQAMEPFLKKSSYIGLVQIHLLNGKEVDVSIGIHPASIYNFIELYGKHFSTLFRGQPCQTMYKYSVSIPVSLPPYPYGKGEMYEGKFTDIKHVHLHNAMGKYKVSGQFATVTGAGGTEHEAQRRAYRTIELMNVPNIQYRIDANLLTSI